MLQHGSILIGSFNYQRHYVTHINQHNAHLKPGVTSVNSHATSRSLFASGTLRHTHSLMSNAIVREPTWFRGELAGVLVAPEAVPLFHEDKMSVSAEQLHPSASQQVWQLRAACMTFPRHAKYPPTTERSPCCSWLHSGTHSSAEHASRCKKQRRLLGRRREPRINSVIPR